MYLILSVKAPKDERDQYICRHHFPALNVMLVCGFSGIFYYCDSAIPGSLGDSPNLMTSPIPDMMQEWLDQGLPFPDAMIGGDSAFQASLPWLCTPFSIAEAASDEYKRRFNKLFCACRDCVERYIGVVKGRFPILALKNGLLFNDVRDSMKLIQVCVAIHNFIVKNQTEEERQAEEDVLQNLADIRFHREVVIAADVPVIPDGSVATHDYLLTKYRNTFRPPPRL